MAKKSQPPAETPTAEPAGEYTVVARRYRPQNFAALIGQEPVARALANAITGGRVAHAYLFTGARGVGKTSAARILAKALNCVTGPTPTPCDVCDSCRAIAAGDDIDVQEIDGASNRGIDEVRAIRPNVGTRPTRSRYKIYIIDEVHMMTGPAFNALLKTLEEPPPHVKFIFATTEVQKIPITILSRCQRFDFAGISVTKIVDRLKEVVIGEGLAADDEALRIVARRAGGSMRDAQSLLEQLLSFGGDRLTADLVHSMLGTAADDRVVALAGAALAKDAMAALGLVAKCADEGLQLSELLDQLIDYWRGLMLLNCSAGEVGEINVADHHRETVLRQSQALTLDTILAGLDVLTSAKSRLRTTGHGQVLLEMAIVRLSRLDDLVPIANLAQWMSQPAQPGTTARPMLSAGGFSASPADPSKKNGLMAPPAMVRANENVVGSAAPIAPLVAPLAETNIVQTWDRVKIEAGVMLAAELSKGSPPTILSAKSLSVKFPSRHNHAYDYCKDSSRTQLVEVALRKVTGQEWSLRFELDATETAAEPPLVPISGRDRERRALEDPLLKQIVSKLEGRLLKMDPGFGEGKAEQATG